MTAEWGRNGKCYLNSSIHSVGLVTLDLFPLSFFGMLYLTPSRFYARLTLASVTILCATGSTSASSDAPSSFEFRRRSDHGSVVVGDFVYIEGGRIRSLNHNNDARAPVNKTLAIDLRQSWTNETVQFIETTKGQLARPHLPQPLARRQRLVLHVGRRSSHQRPYPRPRPLGIHDRRQRQRRMAAAVPAQRDRIQPADAARRGLQRRRRRRGLLPRRPGHHVHRRRRYARPGARTGAGVVQLHDAGVPFGAGGLLVALGGQKGSRTSTASTIGFLDFGVVDVYEPAASTWHKQAATGDVPSPRVAFCMVGAQGRNGSYELFVFGGARRNDGEAYRDVYVLSLPAFRWFRGQDADAPRFFHSCEVVGNRQLLSIGGFNNNDNTSARYSGVDPWKQGLGVFDMTELEWSDGYRADALADESPQVVKDWYNEGYVHPFPFEMASAHQSSFQQRSA